MPKPAAAVKAPNGSAESKVPHTGAARISLQDEQPARGIVEDVDLARRILAEGAHREPGLQKDAGLGAGAVEPPDGAAAVVGVERGPDEAGQERPPVHWTARHRAAAFGVVVLRHGEGEAGDGCGHRCERREVVRAFVEVPAVLEAPDASWLQDDLLV